MEKNFLKIAAGVPEVFVADITENLSSIKNIILKAHEQNINILVLPELSLTAATCADLFFNDLIISKSKLALQELADFTNNKSPLVTVGLPILFNNKLYNCVAVIHNGKILQIVPKKNIPSGRFSTQSRYFSPAVNIENGAELEIGDNWVPMNNDIICFENESKMYKILVEIGDDFSALQNIDCDIILNSASTNHTVGKSDFIKSKIVENSKKLDCIYIFASSGLGESTTDTIYSGMSFIAKNGELLAEGKPFNSSAFIISTTDAQISKKCTNSQPRKEDYGANIEKNPFLPSFVDKQSYLEEILQIQSNALARRISHTHAKTAVIGISGGLDSTLALLVAVRAMTILNRSTNDILAITMPCFGTTKRTRSNSEILCSKLNVSFKEINITESILQHFKDIGQDINDYSVTYENSQARERTQVLMDIANKTGGLVIGTGDLSELALGWATYNGDHMSMYGVNSGVPKTLIRHLVKYEADNAEATLKEVLYDILSTPVSPELLPADEKGEIAQKTEDLVGPYELHDFFLFHMVNGGKAPKEIFNLAKEAFPEYTAEIILHWLTTFTRRFFNQQFKRSCLPDGPKVFSFSLSPRLDLQMPSDAVSKIWLNELKKIEI